MEAERNAPIPRAEEALVPKLCLGTRSHVGCMDAERNAPIPWPPLNLLCLPEGPVHCAPHPCTLLRCLFCRWQYAANPQPCLTAIGPIGKRHFGIAKPEAV